VAGAALAWAALAVKLGAGKIKCKSQAAVAGSRRERLPVNGVGWKWRRNALERLNPGLEMVWARTPPTYNIWYTGAWLIGGSLGVTMKLGTIVSY
jgi:hypothetical protein